MLYYLIIFFILGTLLGSFYNVVGYRLPKDESIIRPKHSYCPNCKHFLKWYELIPLVSFFIQKGKCRSCNHSISWFYPMVELITGSLFAVSFYSFGFTYELIIALSLVSLFSIVIVSDVNFLMIPDEVTLTISIVITITNFLAVGFEKGMVLLGSGILLFLLMYLIMLLGNFLFQKESLGGADIKLMFVAGISLGPILGLLVIFISSVIALPISILLYIWNHEKVIPFGPFIVAAMLLLFLLKIDLDSFISMLQF